MYGGPGGHHCHGGHGGPMGLYGRPMGPWYGLYGPIPRFTFSGKGEEYIDREVNSSLSGGEMKRIEIAMVMAKDTKLYLFDEPEAGIDLWSFKNLIKVFQNMRNEIRGSIIVISHQERIMDIADEIVVLSEGTVVSHDKREEILPCLLKGTGRKCCKSLEVK